MSATLLVATTLTAASGTFVVAQRQQLYGGAESVARQAAADQAALLARDPSLGAGQPSVSGERSIIQVLDGSGRRVVSTSPGLADVRIASLQLRPGRTRTLRLKSLPVGESESFVVVGVGVRTTDGDRVVVAAQSLEQVDQSEGVTIRLLSIGVPILLLIVLAVSLRMTRRALRPVDRLRREVDGIAASDLARRVPVPDGDDEVSHLATTMNAMIARIEEATQRQRQFVADASHELRSPLTTMRAIHEIGAQHLGLLDWGVAGPEVLTEIARLEHLVDDLLFLARRDESPQLSVLTDVDLDELARAESARIALLGAADVQTDLRHVRVRGEPRQLARALRNLVENAARHAESRVALKVTSDARCARIEVTDDGPGIASCDRERVFERFVRLDDSRARDTGGSGLGLAIARDIARSHGGDVFVVDSGRGTTVVLELPRP